MRLTDANGRLRWPALVAMVAVAVLLGLGFSTGLAQEIVWRVFWLALVAGGAAAYIFFAVGPCHWREKATDWESFWEAMLSILGRSLFYGGLAGVVMFSLVTRVNRHIAIGPSYQVAGVVVGKVVPSKGGSYLIVRDPVSGHTFRVGVANVAISLTPIGSQRQLMVCRGGLGWRFCMN
jgi:hypothetical protein